MIDCIGGGGGGGGRADGFVVACVDDVVVDFAAAAVVLDGGGGGGGGARGIGRCDGGNVGLVTFAIVVVVVDWTEPCRDNETLSFSSRLLSSSSSSPIFFFTLPRVVVVVVVVDGLPFLTVDASVDFLVDGRDEPKSLSSTSSSSLLLSPSL